MSQTLSVSIVVVATIGNRQWFLSHILFYVKTNKLHIHDRCIRQHLTCRFQEEYSNLTSCQFLSNMCALTLYSARFEPPNPVNDACSLHRRLVYPYGDSSFPQHGDGYRTIQNRIPEWWVVNPVFYSLSNFQKKRPQWPNRLLCQLEEWPHCLVLMLSKNFYQNHSSWPNHWPSLYPNWLSHVCESLPNDRDYYCTSFTHNVTWGITACIHVLQSHFKYVVPNTNLV